MRFVRPIVATISVLVVLQVSALAADWPQWRGPERTAISAETGLLKSWPKDGPPLVWKTKQLGGGYSTPSVAAGRIFGMGARGGDEVVWALDEATGNQLWSTRIAKHNKGVGSPEGPRGTPTVDGQRIFAVGVSGDLVCLEADTGKEVWRRNFVNEFRGNVPSWGYCESPLVEGNMVIATPGGSDATIAAFDKSTGKTIWTSGDPGIGAKAAATPAKADSPPGGRQRRDRRPKNFEGAGYASPIAFNVGNVRQIATFTANGGIGVRASDGEFLWRNDKAANTTANCATPIFHNNHIFFTSDYGTGCALVKLKPEGPATEVYFNRDMKNHHGGVVLLDNYLYGYNSSNLLCMKFEDGKVAWTNRSVGKGSLCYADGHLYVLSEGGVMGLVEATPSAYKEISRFKTPDRSGKPTWPHPIVANGKLYIRDQDTLLCYDVKQH